MTITVVIPAYNAVATIGACLASALSQTVAPAEIIVVDDGSSDETAKIAHGFGRRVTVITQSNQGSAVARQVGTERARSEYVAYLDADDWWPEDALGRFAQAIGSNEVHFLVGDFVRARPGAGPSEWLPRNTSFFPWFREFLTTLDSTANDNDLYHLPQSDALAVFLRGFPYFPSASLVRRRSVHEIGGWDERFRRCQDFDLALRLARRYPLHYLDRVQAIVGLHGVNDDVDGYVIKQTTGDILVLETHFVENEGDRDYQQKVAKAIAGKRYSLGERYRLTKDYREACRAYRGALKWPGKRIKASIRFLQSTWGGRGNAPGGAEEG